VQVKSQNSDKNYNYKLLRNNNIKDENCDNKNINCNEEGKTQEYLYRTKFMLLLA
jgi:hypothetical protein